VPEPDIFCLAVLNGGLVVFVPGRVENVLGESAATRPTGLLQVRAFALIPASRGLLRSLAPSRRSDLADGD